MTKASGRLTVARGAFRGRSWLAEREFPYSDEIELLTSGLEFAQGGHYGIEIPVINSFRILEMTLDRLKQE